MTEPTRVVCPTCQESIGLSTTELVSGSDLGELNHGSKLASFFCHICQDGWEVRVSFLALEGVSDD